MPKYWMPNRKLADLSIFRALSRIALAIGVALVISVLAERCRAQSFLEKLEAAVRQQINPPVTVTPTAPTNPSSAATNPSGTPAATSAENPSAAAELPLPNRNSIPNPFGNSAKSQPSSPMSSILEGKSVENAQQAPAGPALQLTPGQNPNPQPPQAENRLYLGLEAEELLGGGIGVRVASLTENSPAWKAGFKVGDRIQGIDGHAIASIDSMADRLRRIAAGKPTKFLINRAGRNLELVAVLQDGETANRILANAAGASAVNGPAWLGISASDVSPAFRSQFGLSIFSGAAVTNVVANSPAYLAGVRPGDAIVEISGAPITSGADLINWVAQSRVGEPVEMLVYRGTQRSVISTVLASDPRNPPRVTPPPPAPQLLQPPTPNIARTIASAPDSSGTQNSLEIEVAQLRAQLAEVQAQLLQTQQQLDEVLQQRNNVPIK